MRKQLSAQEQALYEELIAWAKPLNPSLALFSMYTAHAAPALAQCTDWAYHREVLDGIVSDHDEERFFVYYQSRGELIADFLRAYDPESDFSGEELDRQIRRLPKVLELEIRNKLVFTPRHELREKLQQQHRVAKKKFARSARELVLGELPGLDLDLQTAQTLLTTCLPIAFAIRVVVPYWLNFGAWPDDAFRLASKPDKPNMEILKQLVRVDPQVLHHPKLDPVLHPIDRRLEKSRHEKISEAMGKAVEPLEPSKVKRRLAALIAEASLRIQPKRIKPSKIKKLFDLVARCPHPVTAEPRFHVITDPDVPVGDNMRSAIKHYSPLFALPPKPDKKFFDSVRFLNRWIADGSEHGKAA